MIDVERARAEARGRRRAGRGRRIISVVALGLLGVLLVASVAGYAWWRNLRSGPAYSLALLIDAARREDQRAVEQLADMESVAQGLVPQVVERLTGEGTPVPPELRGQVGAALPQLIPRLREAAGAEVARVLRETAEGVVGSAPTPLLAIGVARAAEIRERGDAARVTLRGEGRVTELGMRREGERWRVTEVRDDRLAAELAGRLAAALPQAAPTPQPRRKAVR